LSEEERERQAGPAPGVKVDFSTLLLSLFSSALIQMGEMADPVSGEKTMRLDEARHSIDILDIMAEKTRGNLSPEEEDLLRQTLTQVKMKYVQAVQGLKK
jgi:hypothetical protein